MPNIRCELSFIPSVFHFLISCNLGPNSRQLLAFARRSVVILDVTMWGQMYYAIIDHFRILMDLGEESLMSMDRLKELVP